MEKKEIKNGMSNELECVLKEIWSEDWDVADDGTMQLKYGSHYCIEGDRLTEQNWLNHISQKVFLDNRKGEATFYFAYRYALQKKGITKMEINIKTGDCVFS